MWPAIAVWWAAPSGVNCNGRDSKTSSAARARRSTCWMPTRSRNSLPEPGRSLSSSRPPRSAAFMPTTRNRPRFFLKTCKSRTTSSTRPVSRGPETVVSRQFLHLSQTRAATAQGGISAHRAAGADQRVVCRRQNRRHQTVPGVPPPARLRFHQRHADQHVRAERQLRPANVARAAGVDPEVSRCQTNRRRHRHLLGHGRAVAGISLRRRSGRRLRFPHAKLQRGTIHQRRALAATSASGNWPELVKRVVGFAGEIVWDASKPDGTPRKLMDSSRLFALGWRPQVDLETGIRLRLRGFSRANSRAENNRAFAASTGNAALAGQVVLHHLHVGVHHQFDQVVELRFRFPAQLLFRL